MEQNVLDTIVQLQKKEQNDETFLHWFITATAGILFGLSIILNHIIAILIFGLVIVSIIALKFISLKAISKQLSILQHYLLEPNLKQDENNLLKVLENGYWVILGLLAVGIISFVVL